jgi:isopenicillin N synthase-like dioxygenase
MAVAHNIPLIDLSPYLDSKSSQAAKAKVIDEVKSACSTYGFLQVKRHGVPVQVQRGMLQSCKTLFDLPQAQKDALSLKNNPQRRQVQRRTCVQIVAHIWQRIRTYRRTDSGSHSLARLQGDESTSTLKRQAPSLTGSKVSMSAARFHQMKEAFYADLTNGRIYLTKNSTLP